MLEGVGSRDLAASKTETQTFAIINYFWEPLTIINMDHRSSSEESFNNSINLARKEFRKETYKKSKKYY